MLIITKKIVIVLTLIVFLVSVFDLITFYEPCLYFKDKYLWYTHIGGKHYDMQKEDYGLKYLRKALTLDPLRPEAHVLSARIYESLHMYSRAQQELSLLKSLNETSFYYRHMGRIKLEEYKLNESLSYFKKAYEEDPLYAPNNVRLGLVYLKVNETENAVRYLIMGKSLVNESFPEQPKLRRDIFGTIYAGFGFVYERNGEYKKSNEAFEIAESFSCGSAERVRALIS